MDAPVRTRRRLQVVLIGPLRVRADDVGLDGARLGRRGEAAMARLVLDRGLVVSRDVLADAIWGDRLPPSWAAALRNVIAGLRSELAATGLADQLRLSAIGDGYRLDVADAVALEVDTERLAADVTAAEQAVAAGDPAAAVALAGSWSGRSATDPGVLTRATSDWAEHLRNRVATLRQQLLRIGAEAALAAGDARAAEGFAQTLVAAAPLREDGHRLLMRALAASGNRAAALAEYAKLQRLLADELESEPSAATEAVREDILRSERAGRAGTAGPSDSPASLARLARDLGSAGPVDEWSRAVRYGLRAARSAFEDGVYEDVVAAATRAVAALDAAGNPDPVARLDLRTLLGGAQRALGDDAGHATLHEAFAAARSLGDPVRMADAALAFTHAGAAADEAFVDDLLVDVYREAIDRLGEDDLALRARLLGHLAVGLAWRRGLRLARPPADEALALASGVPDLADRLRILTTVRRALTQTLDLAAVEQVEDELFALAGQLDDPGGRARAAIWRFETRVEQGRGEDLERLLAVAARNVASLRQGSYHHSLAYTQAALALLRGDVETADRLAEEAAAIGLRHGVAAPICTAVRLTQLMAVRWEQGRLAELRDEFVGFFASAGVPEWRGVVAFVRAANGEIDGVREDLRAALEAYDAHGPNMISPPALVALLAVPVVALGDRDRAARLYDDLLPYRCLGGYFAQFSGPLDWALGVLARVMGRGDSARGHFLAGAEFARRVGAPRWERRCLAEPEGRS